MQTHTYRCRGQKQGRHASGLKRMIGKFSPGFLKLLLSAKPVCVCVCVPAPKAINHIHMILNLYNQLNKFVAFRNITKLSMYGPGHCNEARHDRNQSNKAILVLKKPLVSLRG